MFNGFFACIRFFITFRRYSNLTYSRIINSHYPVYCGEEFWEHLTGDRKFYHRLAKAFGEVVEEDNIDGSNMILAKIKEIAKEIEDRGGL